LNETTQKFSRGLLMTLFEPNQSPAHVPAQQPVISNTRDCLVLTIFRAMLIMGIFLSLSRTSAQINTGSDGHDGVFNPTANIIINMATHPDGIYHYTSVIIPANVTVTFTPNLKNTPVVWLVQGNVAIKGLVDVSGNNPSGSTGGLGGPGGYRGGTGGSPGRSGQGPGGGLPGTSTSQYGGNASYGAPGNRSGGLPGPTPTYGNQFLVPLLGGSGGGGSFSSIGGGGGSGGAILIAASGTVQVDGEIRSFGGVGGFYNGSPAFWYGCGSVGAIRLVASKIVGSGRINPDSNPSGWTGRVRFDTYENDFGGHISDAFSQGFQPIIIPLTGQLPQLTVISVAGVPVSPSPTGVLSTPDAVLSAQQTNPMQIVVQCVNLPLKTQITVSIKPMDGLPVSAVGYNDTGTLAASMATVSIIIPRGGGVIYATAATGN
jgi:hypothetical protein